MKGCFLKSTAIKEKQKQKEEIGKANWAWYKLHHKNGTNTTTYCPKQDAKSLAQI